MTAHDPRVGPGPVEEPGDPAAVDAGRTTAPTGRSVDVVLGIYVLVLVRVVLLKIHTDGFGDLVGRRSINMVPLGGTGTGTGGLGSSELAVNVLAFVPLGVLVHLAARRRTFARTFLPVVVLVALAAGFFTWLQVMGIRFRS